MITAAIDEERESQYGRRCGPVAKGAIRRTEVLVQLLLSVEQMFGINRHALMKAFDTVRVYDVLRDGKDAAPATAFNLDLIGRIGAIVGAPRDLIAIGHALPDTPVEVVLDDLRRLEKAATTPYAKAWCMRRRIEIGGRP
jgi:hypothetical protein